MVDDRTTMVAEGLNSLLVTDLDKGEGKGYWIPVGTRN
jgi:hypothetical protein